MNEERLLDRAIALAREAHADQVDKGRAPYIDHPLRVMEAVHAEGPVAMIGAALHDVIEDGGITPDQLRAEGFPEEAIAAVETVTKLDDEKGTEEGYATFIERIAASGSRLAIVVKLADLADNSDLSRLGHVPTEEDLARARKYERSRQRLEAALRELGS
jgi:(p)ppGpp synthase/HD superfamily hydrolase